MSTLTPTVHERIARCGTLIYIDGLVSGADVELDIAGDIIPFVATGGAKNQVVPSLTTDDAVRSRQDDGSGWTPWSPQVVVEDAKVPPDARPILPSQVGRCSHCVRVRAVVPGCEVELLQGGNVVGSGIASRHGDGCFGVKLNGRNEILRAKMIVCGADSPEAASPIVSESSLPEPEVGTPLYGCQRIVPLSELHKGARVRLESSVTGGLGSICSCWNAINVKVGAELVIGHQIRAQSYWDNADDERCREDGPWSDWEDVVAPDEGITPELFEALIEYDQTIRVGNQIAGSELNVYVAASEAEADLLNPDVFGPRPASEEQAIALNAPLRAGNVVWVDQTLCGVAMVSEQVLVQALPPVVHAPEVVSPLYECAGKVTVTGLHAGAVVRVYQDGFPIALGWSGMANSITLEVAPGLTAGSLVTAIQWVGGQESPESPPVPVQNVADVHTPRILSPVTLNDNKVWVSGVTPGAKVAIYSSGLLIGETESAESLVCVPTTDITGPVTATVTFCGDLSQSSEEPVTPIKNPCEWGRWENTGDKYKNYGTITFSDWPDGGCNAGVCESMTVEGQLYYPSIAGGCLVPGDDTRIHPDARNLPLIIIAHGYWPGLPESYQGYGYLANHLASWGFVVFSLHLSPIDGMLSAVRPFMSARAELILAAIDALQSDAEVSPHLDRENIGLIGHSMGGEGVVVTQTHNLTGVNPLPINGIVSIAPTQYREDVDLEQAEYLQLIGSEDYLLDTDVLETDAVARFNGFRLWGRAERNKTHAWIYGATHDQFNTLWAGTHSTDFPVSEAEHQLIAKCLMTAFFLKTLKNQQPYEGYLEGLILPPSIRHIEIYLQHLKAHGDVLDNFGDADAQAGLGSQGLNKDNNRKGGDPDAGGGVSIWDDVESFGSGVCVHDTNCVELAWTEPTAWYVNDGGLNMGSPSQNLSFRICQFFEDPDGLNEEERDIDLLVELSGGGAEAKVRIGIVGIVPFPDTERIEYSVFRTIRIPSDAFKAVNESVSMNAIDKVTFRLSARPTGHILIDDIEVDS